MRPAESFVEQPIRSLQTMLRVLSKDDGQLPTVVPDGIYGPTTTQTVAAFQRKKGIFANGITDQKTWDAIVYDYEQARIRIDKADPIEILLDPEEILRYGDSSPYVFLLQSMLTQLSKDHSQILTPSHSGIMDDDTVQSLKGFQRLAQLPITGEFDRVTWLHLVRQFTLSAHIYAAAKISNTR